MTILKKLCAYFLCLILSLPLFLSPTRAADSNLMRVGWFHQDCYQEMTKENQPYGFNYEYLMYISQYTGWNYSFVPVDSFADCYEMLQSGQIDLMGYLLKSEEREQEVAFPELNCGYAATSLFVRADSTLAAYDFEAYNGIRVACMKSKNPEIFLQYAKKNHFQPQLVYYNNITEIQTAVANHEVDAGLNAGYQPGEETRIIASFAAKPFYFAVQKSDPNALDQLNYALDRLQIENPLLDRELAYKYLPEVRNTLHLTQAEKRYVKETGKLLVSYQSNWSPISWTDPKTGEFRGIVADVFKRVSQLTGLQFQFQEESSAQTAPIQSSLIHNVSSYADGNHLSNTYLNVPLVMVQPKNNNKRSNRTTAMMYPLYKNFEVYSTSDQTVTCYDTFDECLEAVLNGEADQAIVNSYASEQLFKQSKYRDLESNVLYNRAYDLCIGVNETADPILLSILNKGLSVISATDMSAMINQNLAEAFDINLRTIIAYMPPDVILLVVLALLVVVLLTVVILWKQIRYAKRIRELLFTDELTGILTMKGFEAQVKNRIHHAANQKAFLIDFDINHFGDYNAINGYRKGDDLLRCIARILSASCQNTELCARVQADRFVCLLFADTAETIKTRIANGYLQFRAETEIKFLLFSYGIYQVEDRTENISTMCDRALMAKRSIKGNYHRNIAVYNETLHKKQLNNTDLLDSFQSALQNDEFVHYYQPKYDTETQQPVGAEALVRWLRKGDVVLPGQFIELFESNGLIAELDLHMFEKLCQKCAAYLKSNLSPLPISVNFSRVHLFDTGFAEKLSAIAAAYQIPPQLLEIEITETAFAEGRSAMIQTIEDLHAIGFLVSIDDFGSGFSSLNTLKDADFDIVKLDRDFLNSAGQTSREENVIARVIELAKDLNLKTVAEGVETGLQYDMMRRCGCDTIQGYYFSPPITERAFDLIVKHAQP